MTKLTYKEQLLHPNWQRKRLEALQKADWSCEECGAHDQTLHVHHKRYVKGRMAWEYALEELAVMCFKCHENEHSARADFDMLLALNWESHDLTGRDIAIGFLAGFFIPFQKEAITEVFDRVYQQPFFDIGFMVAALGPLDLADAVRRKQAAGLLPDIPLLDMVLENSELLAKQSEG